MAVTGFKYYIHTVKSEDMQKKEQLEKIKEKGFFIIPRYDVESAIFNKPPLYLKVWIYMLNRAQYKPYKSLTTGQLHCSYDDIMEGCSWYVGYRKKRPTKDEIHQILHWLRNPDEGNKYNGTKTTTIQTTRATRGLLITICNYDSYSDYKYYGSNDGSNDGSNENNLREQRQANTINKNSINTEYLNTEKEATLIPSASLFKNLSNEEETKTTVDQGSSPETKEAKYQQLQKTSKEILRFIKTEAPDFIEPYTDLWNLFAKANNKPLVVKNTDQRKRSIKARLKEPEFNFPSILTKANKSEFLLSKSWFTYDWVIKNQDNYLKLLEGNYSDASQLETGSSVKLREKRLQFYGQDTGGIEDYKRKRGVEEQKQKAEYYDWDKYPVHGVKVVI